MKQNKIPQNEKGYALIEVVFLVTVIAILSSIVVPKISESFKIARADHLMKTIYSELRFIQATTRLTFFDGDNIFDVHKPVNNFYVVIRGTNVVVESNKRLRSYEIPSGFYFEKNFFMSITDRGIVHDYYNDAVSGRVKLMNNSKLLRPVIVFDSVGRIRFSDH